MLGKLIKHDMKYWLKIMLGMYGLITIFTLIAFGLSLAYKYHPENMVLMIAKPISTFVYVAGIIVMFVLTLILGMIRFEKNLFGDEGYLTNTIPVKPFNLIVSKVFTQMVWFAGDCVVFFLSLSLFLRKITWLKDVIDFFKESVQTDLVESGIDISSSKITGYLVFMGIYMVIAMLSFILQVYTSISIGYTSRASKGAMSFVAYIATYFITQVLSLVMMVAIMLIDFNSITIVFQENVSADVPMKFVAHLFIGMTGLMVGMCAVYNLVMNKILTKKLNLE